MPSRTKTHLSELLLNPKFLIRHSSPTATATATATNTNTNANTASLLYMNPNRPQIRKRRRRRSGPKRRRRFQHRRIGHRLNILTRLRILSGLTRLQLSRSSATIRRIQVVHAAYDTIIVQTQQAIHRIRDRIPSVVHQTRPVQRVQKPVLGLGRVVKNRPD